MLVEYAKRELELAKVGDEYDGMLVSAVLEIIQVFANQGHSGCSADMVMSYTSKLMRFRPLTPLTGEADEWCDLTDYNTPDMTHQNKRLSTVFKHGEGWAYDIDSPLGPRTPITFPYFPDYLKG